MIYQIKVLISYPTRLRSGGMLMCRRGWEPSEERKLGEIEESILLPTAPGD